MAKTFGKVNRSASFNPTSAFPLDARYYFETLADAELAAASAVEVGSADGTYFYGENVVVVTETEATLYVIQPDKTLKPVGVTTEQVDYSLTVEESSPEGYAKAYTFKQLDKTIATISVPKDMVVESGSVVTNPEGQAEGTYIKLILANADEDELYINVSDLIEYVTGGTSADGMIAVTVDNDHVVTATINDGAITMAKLHADIQASLGKAHDHGNKTLLDAITTEKITAWDAAQVNVIDSVDETQFALDEAKNLTLLDIAMGKVTGLTEALAGKVDAVEGSRLITSDEADKLEKLILGDDGSVEISATIAADKVDGLADWITANAGTLAGLSENNFDDTLMAKLDGIAEGAEVNYVKSVSDEFTVSDAGELSVNGVNVNKLTQTEGEYLILNGGASA